MVFFCKFAKCGFGVHFCGFGAFFCGFGGIFCGFSVRFCGFRVRPSLTCPRRRCPPLPRQPPACCSRSARCPTTGAPARSPSRAASPRKAAHAARTQPSARHHPRRHLATGRRTRVAQRGPTERLRRAAWRCPWQQQVPPHHPPAASASLSHATPPPMHTSNATSDPAVTGNIRGDGASASTDHHNSSDKRHGFCPVQVSGPLQPRWSHASGEGMAFWRGAAVCLRAHGAFRGAPAVCSVDCGAPR